MPTFGYVPGNFYGSPAKATPLSSPPPLQWPGTPSPTTSGVLARMGMTCATWSANKNPDARARNVQLALGVSEADAASIRDRVDAFCANQVTLFVDGVGGSAHANKNGWLTSSGSIASWWNSEPIAFTSKNYVVGGAVGLVLGALAMHLSMKKKR